MAVERLKNLPRPVKIMAGFEAILKIVAIRRAVRNGQLRWAMALVVVNSGGLLPVIYLLRFQRRR